MLRIAMLALVLSNAILSAAQTQSYILASSRTGVIEIIDPATLAAVARIHLQFPPGNAGLNGASASSDGSMLFVEGPIPEDPRGCCVLYSIDLATRALKVAASISGSISRSAYVFADGVVYPSGALSSRAAFQNWKKWLLYVSRDGRVFFGVQNHPPGEIHSYNTATGASETHEVAQMHLSGALSGNRFYAYGRDETGNAKLWTVASDGGLLGDGVSVEPGGIESSCGGYTPMAIAGSGGRIFLYESFGFKIDRRLECGESLPGGAWTIDPDTGWRVRRIAPELHFSSIVSDRGTGPLYAVTATGPSAQAPVSLVKIDADDGRILQSKTLESTFWRIAIAPLATVPGGDIYIDTTVSKP